MIVHDDQRRPDRHPTDPDVRRLIDFHELCTVVMGAASNLIGEDDCADGIVAAPFEYTPPGLVLIYALANVPASAMAIREVRAELMKPRRSSVDLASNTPGGRHMAAVLPPHLPGRWPADRRWSGWATKGHFPAEWCKTRHLKGAV